MCWMLVPLIALLALRPVRRAYLRHATFTLPATFGFFVGLLVGAYEVNNLHVPPLMVPANGIAGALVFGEAGHEYFRRFKP